MAGDWIKMRVGLRRHPKVVRMASALKADKLRIVGALHAVWGLFDEHSADGRLPGYTLEVLDEDLAFSGFGQALVEVEWLEVADGALAMPRFDAHNGQSAKRRAQDADRKRVERQASASQADTRPDANVTREEKRREEASSSLRSDEARGSAQSTSEAEKSRRAPSLQIPMADKSLVLPDWLMPYGKQWAAFERIRWKKNSKSPYTLEAQTGILRKLKQFQDEGQDVGDVLDASVNAGWTGVFPQRGPKRPPAASFVGKNYSGGELEHDFPS